MNIVLVGGGNASVTLLDYFQKFKDHDIVGIADIREDAPGVQRAKQLGIATTQDMKSLVQRSGVNLIIELTGVAKVREELTSFLRADQRMVCSDGAKLMCDLITAQHNSNAGIVDRVSERFDELMQQLQNIIKNIDVTYRGVNKLILESKLISLNANIEAARLGKLGNPFNVVANRIRELVASIQQALDSIGSASESCSSTIGQMAQTKEDLQSSFRVDTDRA